MNNSRKHIVHISLRKNKQARHLHVLHHGGPLCIEFGAVWTLEHMHLLIGQVSVKMHIEQGLLGKNGLAHHALVDHPGDQTERQREKT